MRSDKKRRRLNRKATVETLEVRQVMSADPLGGLLGDSVAESAQDELAVESAAVPELELHASTAFNEQAPDFWLDTTNGSFEDQLYEIEQSLASAHGVTGLTQVRENYGFLGTGQTVAVIDSGIAWDHYALGGGLGANYRVVGGWDFSEKDADPYDDGPRGSHGTHVSGIIGANTGSSTGDTGVAPGVDLVGLRVFNDSGAGYFSWVEDALEWVHLNRNSFENPITTVNLSLGTNWNADTVPSWAMLEDEFAQLEADGIFIAVSAGNSFATYNAPGLSYPAASSHVVPVMSVDDSGLLSYYSQRSSRSIAAPGRYIRSTMPDYGGNHNGRTDDWASMSGTSMAAPYVAGASAIVREAMEFIGRTSITQQTIYDHMIATADRFFDAATNAYYSRLNLGNAIDALIPDDDFGSSVIDAYNMGTIGAGTSLAASTSSMEMAGLIGKLDDADYFTFTAGVTGTVSFTVSTTHQLTEVWDTCACATWSIDGQTLTLDVVAGRSYSVGLSSEAGLGYYDLTIDVEAAFSFTDWGSVIQSRTDGFANSGEAWYRVEASRAGYLTIEALFASAGGDIDLALYDANLQLLAAGVAAAGTERIDIMATAGQEFYLRVTGTNADVDFRLTNLVSVEGTTASVAGTAAADAFTFAAGAARHVVSVNGVSYEFEAGSVSRINFSGGDGNDSITMTGTAGNENAELRAGNSTLSGSGYTASAASVENAMVYGGGGSDTVDLFDTLGDDLYLAWSTHVLMSGSGYYNYARGFDATVAQASGGQDQAIFYDSAGDDEFTARPEEAKLTGAGYSNQARQFDNVQVYGTTGYDRAYFYDSSGDDLYRGWSNQALMMGAGYFNYVAHFDKTYAYASTGYDRADLFDTSGDDLYLAWSTHVLMSGSGYYNYARGFDATVAQASGGQDQAIFYDSAGDDEFTARPEEAKLTGAGYSNQARQFDNVQVYGTTGYDRAYFYDSSGDDLYRGWSNQALMMGAGYFNYVAHFDKTYANASTGYDRADLFDTSGDDLYLAWSTHVLMSGSGYYNYARGFDATVAQASGGQDQAIFYDSAGDDEFTARPEEAKLTGAGYSNQARQFDNVQVYGTTGYDRAYFYDSSGDDLYRGWSNQALMMGAGYFNYVAHFDKTYAYASTGYDRADLFDTSGKEMLVARAQGANLEGEGYFNEIEGFDSLAAQLTNDEDEVDVEATDYVFKLFGTTS